jgi:hypothetical protein
VLQVINSSAGDSPPCSTRCSAGRCGCVRPATRICSLSTANRSSLPRCAAPRILASGSGSSGSATHRAAAARSIGCAAASRSSMFSMLGRCRLTGPWFRELVDRSGGRGFFERLQFGDRAGQLVGTGLQFIERPCERRSPDTPRECSSMLLTMPSARRPWAQPWPSGVGRAAPCIKGACGDRP